MSYVDMDCKRCGRHRVDLNYVCEKCGYNQLENKWILADQLPDLGGTGSSGEVIICMTGGFVTTGYWSKFDNRWHTITGNTPAVRVEFWQPLPEPPTN